MDVHDPARPSTTTDTSSPSPHHPTSVSGSKSNAQVAALLADAYRDIDSLRSEVKVQRKRAEKAERIVHVLHSDPTSSPGSATTNGTPTLDVQQLQQKHNETMSRLAEDYEEKLRLAESARDEAESRRRLMQESWDQLEHYLSNVELRAKDARNAFTRISSSSSNGPLSLPPLPSPTGLLTLSPPSATTHHYGGSSSSMAPPGSVPRHSSRHSSSRSGPVAFPLPPHPNPNPSHPSGSRRPRTPSMDPYGATQPPTKRSRTNADDQRGREPRTSYSESYIQHHQHPDSRDFQDQLRARQQLLHRQHPEARIIDRKYGSSSAYPPGYHQHSRRPGSPSHSRSGSRSSQSSVEDFILDAAGVAGAPAPSNGSRYYDGQSPRPHGAPIPNHQGVATTTNPYPTTTSYPANQSAPGSLRNVQGSQSHVYTTHVFAPVVTGAPTKKSKFPNTANNPLPSLPGSGPSVDTPQAQASGQPPTVPFAATNEHGQRICRQCGMVGRYKDGKCVEKWGPGPMGPGTVCDRCRKKMKRVERRGTLESQQQLQNLAVQQVQQQQYQPRATSQAQLPLSQGSDRSIQRSDTLITNQSSHGPASFVQRDDSTPQHSSSRTSTVHVSPAKASSRQAPTPPSIAALREQNDDEDEEHDPDQLPTSNVGRGGGVSAGHSRSNSRNGRGGGTNGASAKRSSLGTAPATRGSISPSREMEVDEMDADADADAEAEAEAEIMGAIDAAEGEEGDGDGEGEMEADADAEAELLEAVDAAEANSSSSHGGERGWLKAES